MSIRIVEVTPISVKKGTHTCSIDRRTVESLLRKKQQQKARILCLYYARLRIDSLPRVQAYRHIGMNTLAIFYHSVGRNIRIDNSPPEGWSNPVLGKFSLCHGFNATCMAKYD